MARCGSMTCCVVGMMKVSFVYLFHYISPFPLQREWFMCVAWVFQELSVSRQCFKGSCVFRVKAIDLGCWKLLMCSVLKDHQGCGEQIASWSSELLQALSLPGSLQLGMGTSPGPGAAPQTAAQHISCNMKFFMQSFRNPYQKEAVSTFLQQENWVNKGEKTPSAFFEAKKAIEKQVV